MNMQLMNKTFRYDVLKMKLYITKKNVLKQNYSFHGNLKF